MLVLKTTIADYVATSNQNPRIFVWTASVEGIMRKTAKCRKACDALHQCRYAAARNDALTLSDSLAQDPDHLFGGLSVAELPRTEHPRLSKCSQRRVVERKPSNNG